MKVTGFDDVREFQRQAGPVLADHEAEYNMAIGVLADLAANGWQGRYAGPPLLAMVEDQEGPVGLAIHTPPHGLLLTGLPTEAMPILGAWLRGRPVDPPWVLAPEATAEVFAAEWARLTARKAVLKHALRTHALRRVVMPPPPPRLRHGAGRSVQPIPAGQRANILLSFHRSGQSNGQQHLPQDRL